MRTRRARVPPERVERFRRAMCRANGKTPTQGVWGGDMATASGQQQARGVWGRAKIIKTPQRRGTLVGRAEK